MAFHITHFYSFDFSSDTLRIQWNVALSVGMKPSYCIAINAQENLYYRCTALARLKHVNLSETGEQIRPHVYVDTDRLRPAPITEFVYQCVETPHVKVKLPPSLASLLPALGSKTSSKLFINVYAVNARVDLSTAFAVYVIENPVRRCKARRAIYEVTLRSPTAYSVLWNVDFVMNWVKYHNQSMQLFYQPCRLPGNGRPNFYKLHVYRLLRSTDYLEKPLVCEHSVQNSHMLALCNHTIKNPGEYRMWLDSDRLKFQSGQPVGRLSVFTNSHYGGPQKAYRTTRAIKRSNQAQLLSRLLYTMTIQEFGQMKPCFFSEFETRLTQILKMSTGTFRNPDHSVEGRPIIPGILQNSARVRRRTWSKLLDSRQRQRTSISDWSKSRRLRNKNNASPNVHVSTAAEPSEGLKLSIDCQGHQVYISLATHPKPHNYWIYTVPIADELAANPNHLFEQLNNMTDYCEFPVAAFRQLAHASWRRMHCVTAEGQTELRFFTPAHDQNGYPRHYHVLVYVASQDDTSGTYQELLAQTVFDACQMTTDSCYRTMTRTCKSSNRATLPEPEDPFADYHLTPNQPGAICQVS
ncbi:uncharacterized protein DEA37_0013329 [Paragonimus westermani]|uniref:Uncharacterized protein n=1 Tax=Paragonimus westermani TaxID=34504 RepID=A0A5J4NUH1_9TREM|nr:uncharacterized protein DEA37_0013329 [Paragonimus westermani]